jgi:hypothetical protein
MLFCKELNSIEFDNGTKDINNKKTLQQTNWRYFYLTESSLTVKRNIQEGLFIHH